MRNLRPLEGSPDLGGGMWVTEVRGEAGATFQKQEERISNKSLSRKGEIGRGSDLRESCISLRGI